MVGLPLMVSSPESKSSEISSLYMLSISPNDSLAFCGDFVPIGTTIFNLYEEFITFQMILEFSIILSKLNERTNLSTYESLPIKLPFAYDKYMTCESKRSLLRDGTSSYCTQVFLKVPSSIFSTPGLSDKASSSLKPMISFPDLSYTISNAKKPSIKNFLK